MQEMRIPVSFEYEGILFEGYFVNPSGGGGHSWHLSLFNYAYGQLVKYNTGWQWCPNAKNLFTEDYMVEFFLKTITEHGNKPT